MTPWAVVSPARLAGAGLLRTQSDDRLVDLVRAGNDRAFEAIVHRHRRALLRHCHRLLPAGPAEDVVQQTFLRALEAIRADERELRLGPWLHRIAHNAAIDSLRRLDSQWEELDERMDGVEPTHAAAERRARFRSVVAGIERLPERQRRALVLRELEGRSYDEIAAALGVSGAGVRQLLNRARNAMRAGASALVPPALVARLAGSQAGVRVAELADPPGTSALLAKTAAAVAAGTVAVLAVHGPGDRPSPSRAEASPRPPDSASRAPGSPRPAGRSAEDARAAGSARPARNGARPPLPRTGRNGDQPSRRTAAAPRAAPHTGRRGPRVRVNRPVAREQGPAGPRVVPPGDDDADDREAAPGTDETDDQEETPGIARPADDDGGDDDVPLAAGGDDEPETLGGSRVPELPAGPGDDDEGDDDDDDLD